MRTADLSPEDAAAAQDPLGELEQLADVVQLGRGERRRASAARRARRGLVAALGEGRHVALVAGVVGAAAQLGQQRFETGAQLQGRLAVAAGVEVGAGAQQQRLAGVEPFAAAEHRGEALLRAQLLLAPPPRRAAAGRDGDLAGDGEAAGGDLLAAAEADPARDRALGGERRQRRVGGGDGVGVEGAVEQRQPPRRPAASTESSSATACSSQAPASASPANGSWARTAVTRASGRLGGSAPASAARGRRRRRGGGRRRAERLDHQHALGAAPRAR